MKGHQDCPFCGNSGALDTLNYTSGKPVMFRVQCQVCKSSTGWYGTEEEAWKAWDMRKTDVSLKKNPEEKKKT